MTTPARTKLNVWPRVIHDEAILKFRVSDHPDLEAAFSEDPDFFGLGITYYVCSGTAPGKHIATNKISTWGRKDRRLVRELPLQSSPSRQALVLSLLGGAGECFQFALGAALRGDILWPGESEHRWVSVVATRQGMFCTHHEISAVAKPGPMADIAEQESALPADRLRTLCSDPKPFFGRTALTVIRDNDEDRSAHARIAAEAGLRSEISEWLAWQSVIRNRRMVLHPNWSFRGVRGQ